MIIHHHFPYEELFLSRVPLVIKNNILHFNFTCYINNDSCTTQEADHVFTRALFYDDPKLQKIWRDYPAHPLQEQEPNGDRQWISKFPILQVAGAGSWFR